MASMADYDICNRCGSLQKVYPHNGRRLCATCCEYDEEGDDKDAELAALRAELEQARAERDAVTKEREEARLIADSWRGIANINEVLLASANHDDERSRETIRRLVVAARAAIRSLRTLAGTPARWQMALLALKVNMMLVKEQAEQTKGGE
jgi:hypothetical protein